MVEVQCREDTGSQVSDGLEFVTGKDGCVALESGLGDMVAFAFKDGRLGIAKIGSEYTELILDRNVGDEFALEFHLVPPPENPLPSYASDEQIASNSERLKQEDVIRAGLHQGVVNSSTIENFKRSAATQDEQAKVENVLECISGSKKEIITSHRGCECLMEAYLPAYRHFI